MVNKEKKKDIKDFIRIYVATTGMREDIIPAHVSGVLAKLGKTDDIDTISDSVLEKISSDEYIEELVPAFDEFFTHDDIKCLIAFYTSDVMKKTGTEQDPTKTIFNSISQVAEDVVLQH